jgi:hypothetical protein
MSDETHDPELTSLEAALAALRPVPDRIARDQLLFRAGQASVGRRWLWPGATATLALIVAVQSSLLLWRPAPSERVPQQVPAAISHEPEYVPQAAPPEDGYFHLRQLVLRDGVEALPRVPSERPSRAPEQPSRPTIRNIPWSGDSL